MSRHKLEKFKHTFGHWQREDVLDRSQHIVQSYCIAVILTHRKTSLHEEHKRGSEQQIKGVQANVCLIHYGSEGSTHTSLSGGVIVAFAAEDLVIKVRHGRL